MANYVCTNCNYKSNLESSSECPYCGEQTIEKEKDASELLDEIEEILES